MQAKLRCTWMLLDYSKPRGEEATEVLAGTYELESVANPYGLAGLWLVLKGTTIGMAQSAWADHPGLIEMLD